MAGGGLGWLGVCVGGSPASALPCLEKCPRHGSAACWPALAEEASFALHNAYLTPIPPPAPLRLGPRGTRSVLKLAEHFHRGAGVLPSLGQVAFAGLAGWGLYAGQAPLLALVIFGGQLVASAVSDA